MFSSQVSTFNVYKIKQFFCNVEDFVFVASLFIFKFYQLFLRPHANQGDGNPRHHLSVLVCLYFFDSHSDGLSQNEDAHEEDQEEEEPHEESIHDFGHFPPLSDAELCGSLVLV